MSNIDLAAERDSAADQAFAEKLQHEEATGAMMDSHQGKAVLLVMEIISLVRSTNDAYPGLKGYNIQSVAYDDMAFLAEKMLKLQSKFAKSKHPTKVDIGYHYTKEDNLPLIKTHGLLTKGDR